MMIRVMYPNGDYDIVRNDILDLLVANQRVKKFKRSSGWIDIERENARLRAASNPDWDGVERRAT